MSQVVRQKLPQITLLFVSLVALALLVIFSLVFGSVMVPLEDLLSVAFDSSAKGSSSHSILWTVRIPRTLAAMMAGMALSMGGLMMQTLFRNPLVGPSVLGVNAGASFGVALVVLASDQLGFSFIKTSGTSLLLAACFGASIVLMFVLFLSNVVGRLTLLVIGILCAQFISALQGVLVYFSSPEQVQAFAMWNLGSFANMKMDDMTLIFPFILLGIAIACTQIKSLNAWLLGVNYASSLGVNVKASKTILIASASILAGAVTCFCGPVAFLGVAVPHLSRALHRTSDHRVLLPSTLILGAAVALVSDLVARLPGTAMALPINPVLALVGAPIVISVVLKSERMRETL